MNSELLPSSNFILYTTPNGEVKLKVFLQDETLWLTQKMMAELFGADVRTISEHLKNIFRSAELREEAVIRKIRITASDGKSYETNCYNLDAIISVGYRVNSSRATQFRIWATQVLREYAPYSSSITFALITTNSSHTILALRNIHDNAATLYLPIVAPSFFFQQIVLVTIIPIIHILNHLFCNDDNSQPSLYSVKALSNDAT
ncbi:MAG: virulence RhuM family protein [Nitrospirae bacterium]|nr:virulence RhuM family protein [Nitrospirota bacterium]